MNMNTQNFIEYKVQVSFYKPEMNCLLSSCIDWKIRAADSDADLGLWGTTLITRVGCSVVLWVWAGWSLTVGSVGKRGSASPSSTFSGGLLVLLPCITSLSFDACNFLTRVHPVKVELGSIFVVQFSVSVFKKSWKLKNKNAFDNYFCFQIQVYFSQIHKLQGSIFACFQKCFER